MPNRISILTLIAVVITALGTALTANAQTTWHVDNDAHHPDAAPELLIATDAREYGEPGFEAYVTRARAVRVNAEVLQALEALKLERVMFNLFKDVRFVGVVERIGSPRDGTIRWSGPLESSELGGFTMVARDGVAAAHIWTASGRVYRVLYTGGVHWVREVDPAQVEPCGADDMEFASGEESRAGDGRDDDGHPLYGGGGNCDGIAEIDVMFLYTPAARDAAGGAAEIESRVDIAVAIANDAYWNSEIQARVRVVHITEVDYVESEDPNDAWLQDLRNLTNLDDGYMDEIHPLRDAVGADAVTLILTTHQGLCGKAWTTTTLTAGRATKAFSLVAPGCLPSYVYAHELGHNLGCGHNNTETYHDGPLYGYSLGHCFTGQSETRYRTVMAQCSGTRIWHFSNPNVSYDGVPTGVPAGDPNDADNASTINVSARVTAQFRVRPDDCNGNCTGDEDDIANGTSADADDNGIPDECEAPVLYVKQDAAGENHGTSWEHGYTDLQDALTVASNPLNAAEDIWVAGGTYLPDRGSSDRAATFFLPRGIAVYGGFDGTESSLEERNPDPSSNGTILSADIGLAGDDSDNSYQVATAWFLTEPRRLDGFSVVDANGDFVLGPYRGGAGLDATRTAVTVANCVFADNSAYWRGGGIHSYATSLHLAGCTFNDNVAVEGGGGAVSIQGDAGELTAVNCTFLHNISTDGGGILLYDAPDTSAVISNCVFVGNEGVNHSAGGGTGGGIRARGVDLTVIGCTFINNTTGAWGGGLNFRGNVFTPLVADCIFVGNYSGTRGGAIHINRAAPSIVNCTVVDNYADEGGGGLSVGGSGSEAVATLRNAVFRGNASPLGPELYVSGGALVDVAYSNVAGGQAAAFVDGASTLEWLDGNIDADPLFVDADGPDNDPNTWDDNDYRLSPGSPCIDAADNTAVPRDTLDLDGDGDTDERIPFDLDGNPRFVQDPFTDDTGVPDPPYYRYVVDMGAYEYQFCFGDLDEDDDIDLADLAQLLGSYGETAGMTYYDGDLDGDGDVDLADLAELLGVYGTVCE